MMGSLRTWFAPIRPRVWAGHIGPRDDDGVPDEPTGSADPLTSTEEAGGGGT